MSTALLAFTDRGFRLAQELAAALGGQAERCARDGGLQRWTERHFAADDALIYVGAAGIAVRAVAPHCQHKTRDPAVVVVDELGRYAIPILSGHLGGANALARQIGRICGAQPVITTGTDINGVFAVDTWAKHQNCAVVDPARIKTVSGALLAGQSVRIRSTWPIDGVPPENVVLTDRADADVTVDITAIGQGLLLVPRIGVLGVGCRRDTTAEKLEAAFARWLDAYGICPESICAAATIDLKQDETGLLAFCKAHDWPLSCYSASRLGAVEGEFSPSRFVKEITGVDNVCERAAVLASGGILRAAKWAQSGVTFALALKPCHLDWSDRDE